MRRASSASADRRADPPHSPAAVSPPWTPLSRAPPPLIESPGPERPLSRAVIRRTVCASGAPVGGGLRRTTGPGSLLRSGPLADAWAGESLPDVLPLAAAFSLSIRPAAGQPIARPIPGRIRSASRPPSRTIRATCNLPPVLRSTNRH
jgi:hypothetical protein